MNQKILYGGEAREQLLEGVNALANVVASTLGPSGHNVILDLEPGNPVATKDGVTIAKAVKLDCPVRNAGAQMLKQASIKTAEEAGDGTTTATVLARELFVEASKLNPKYNTVDVIRGMEAAVKNITATIRDEVSKPVESIEQLKQIATISANGDTEIGALVSKALDKVGQQGAVTIEESKTGESYLDIVEGIQFDRGYKSPYFVTDNNTMTAVLEDALVLLVDKKLTNIKEMLPVLEGVARSTKSLLIVAEDIDGELLSALVLNKLRAGLKVCAVKAPEFGDKRKDALEDIAVLTGGTVVSPEKGMNLEKFNTEWLGEAEKVTVTRDNTTIIGAKGSEEAINVRLEEIKSLFEKKTNSSYEKEQLQNRLARFAGGVAVMYVGGHTELEMKERKDRVDDALHATKAALEEGVCPGGGKALLYAACIADQCDQSENEAFNAGWDIVAAAAKKPFIQILDNAGMNVRDDDWINGSGHKDNWTSFNPVEKQWVNMYEAGIIDPTKVVRLALRNAVSVAGTMITSEALVVNVPEKEDSSAAQMPAMY